MPLESHRSNTGSRVENPKINDNQPMPARREVSRSPYRNTDQDRQTTFVRQSSVPNSRAAHREDGHLNQSSLSRQEYEGMSRQQAHSIRQSYVDKDTAQSFDKFSSYYKQQESSRQQHLAAVETFKKKSREELRKEFARIQMKKNTFMTVFILSVLAIIILFGMFIAKHSSRKPFCNTGERASESCEPCPENGICKGGRLTQCNDRYRLQDDICVAERSNERLVYLMYHEAMDLLEHALGDFNVGWRPDSAGIDKEQIAQYLALRHGDHQDFSESRKEVMGLLSSYKNRDVQTEYSQGKTIIRSTNAKYSIGGWAKLFFMQYKYFLIPIFAVLIALAYFIWLLSIELANRKKAEDFYRRAETYVLDDPRCFVLEDDLKRMLAKDLGMSKADINAIWPYVRYEAESRQKVDFVRKVHEGIEQGGRWIDRKA